MQSNPCLLKCTNCTGIVTINLNTAPGYNCTCEHLEQRLMQSDRKVRFIPDKKLRGNFLVLLFSC